MEKDIDPKLTNLCNEKTTQEDSRGFFNSLFESIIVNTQIKEWVHDLWSSPLYGEDFILELINQKDMFKQIMETFVVTEVYHKKCNKTAKKILSETENHWRNENWEQCKTCCSQAILRASPIMNEYIDQDHQVEGCYIIQQSLLLRARCFLKQNKIQLAKSDVSLCLQYGKLEGHLKKNLQVILQELKSINAEKEKNNDQESSGPSSEYQEMPTRTSKLIEISETASEGRFFTAATNIDVGSNLVIEEPYAACLKHQFFGTHCHNCFSRLEAPIGCIDCANVAFCSKTCLDEASVYHKYECKLMNIFIGSGMSILCFIALRMITQRDLQSSLNIFHSFVKPKSIESYENATNNDLQSKMVYQLCTHEKYRNSDDYIKRVLMALFLLRCLQKSSYFNKSNTENSNDSLSTDEVSVWCLLLFNLQMLQFNAHQVLEMGRSQELACALYPNASLFNHSCSPSITRYFIGKKIIIKAIRSIEKGELVGDNYGPHWGYGGKSGKGQEKEERQKMLRSRYWFNCHCLACQLNWPLPPRVTPNIRCPESLCKGSIDEISEIAKCNVCMRTVDIQYIKEKRNTLNRCIKIFEDEQKCATECVILEKTLSEYWSSTRQPCSAVLNAEKILRIRYNNLISPLSSK